MPPAAEGGTTRLRVAVLHRVATLPNLPGAVNYGSLVEVARRGCRNPLADVEKHGNREDEGRHESRLAGRSIECR